MAVIYRGVLYDPPYDPPEVHSLAEHIAELEEKLWRTEQESEQAVNGAAEMIERRIAELENQWISVEDEMPSAEHAMVIVDFYGGNVGVGYPHKGKILDEPMGMLFNGVTHWMPLPKPQKEQE